MPVPKITDSFSGLVNKITLGDTQTGTRTSTVTVGGAANVVYGGSAEKTAEKPVIALDVLDSAPTDWPDVLANPYKNVLNDPAAWAKMCVEELGVDLICLKFEGIHPDKGDLDASHAVKVTKDVLGAVGVPVILWCCGNDEKDNQVMPKVSEAAKGENCLIGTVTEDNYKALTAVALADSHHLIT